MNSSKTTVGYSALSTTDYDSMSLEKIREQMYFKFLTLQKSEILEDQLHRSDNQEKFADAQISKQRIEYLRKVEKEKVLQLKKSCHEEDVNNKVINKLANEIGNTAKRGVTEIQ